MEIKPIVSETIGRINHIGSSVSGFAKEQKTAILDKLSSNDRFISVKNSVKGFVNDNNLNKDTAIGAGVCAFVAFLALKCLKSTRESIHNIKQ